LFNIILLVSNSITNINSPSFYLSSSSLSTSLYYTLLNFSFKFEKVLSAFLFNIILLVSNSVTYIDSSSFYSFSSWLSTLFHSLFYNFLNFPFKFEKGLSLLLFNIILLVSNSVTNISSSFHLFSSSLSTLFHSL